MINLTCRECGAAIGDPGRCDDFCVIDFARYGNELIAYQDAVAVELVDEILKCETIEQLNAKGDEIKRETERCTWLAKHSLVREVFGSHLKRLKGEHVATDVELILKRSEAQNV